MLCDQKAKNDFGGNIISHFDIKFQWCLPIGSTTPLKWETAFLTATGPPLRAIVLSNSTCDQIDRSLAWVYFASNGGAPELLAAACDSAPADDTSRETKKKHERAENRWQMSPLSRDRHKNKRRRGRQKSSTRPFVSARSKKSPCCRRALSWMREGQTDTLLWHFCLKQNWSGGGKTTADNSSSRKLMLF